MPVLVRRRRASVQRPAARPRGRRAARQRHRRPASSGDAGLSHQPDAVEVGPLRRRARAGPRTAFATAIDQILLARDARRHGSRPSSGSGDVWNDDQPRALRAARSPAARRARRPAETTSGPASRRIVCRGCGWRPRPVPAGAPAAAAVTIVLSCLVDGARRGVGILIATGRVYGGPARALRADRLRRVDARHAGAAAAVRPLLRPRVRDPAAGVSRPRCSAWR